MEKLHRALTHREKIAVIIAMVVIIVVVGLTRPLWSKTAKESSGAATTASSGADAGEGK